MKKYVLYGIVNAYRLTDIENYNAYIQNGRKIHYFNGFKSVEEVVNYILKYFPISIDQIIINVH